ncbi:MAG: zinc-binding dehydrogenase [Actinomycetota bacterium]
MTNQSETALPTETIELRSTVGEDGRVVLGQRRSAIPELGDDQVLIRVEAAPINPSDLGMLFAGGDVTSAAAVDGELPAVSLPLSDGALAASGGRLGRPMPTGNEGAGTVIATGSDPAAAALQDQVVGFLSGTAYAQFRVVPAAQCLPMTSGTAPSDAAAAFVNPLTALGMVETMRAEGHRALVHTVGASNLGLMLNRICQNDGVALVNIVRKEEHVAMLRDLGAANVCNSSSPDFTTELTDALKATGATIAFDAIGGGELATTILSCMESAASGDAEFSRYGSDTHKQVYIYGGLDRGPTTIRRTFGMSWSIGGWLLTPFLARIGQEAADRLRSRVAAEITTTFASSYGMRLSLDEVVDPAMVGRYGQMATGDKALVEPQR